MADYTENYNLKKPADADYYDVEDFNGNADIIDTALDDKLNKDFSNVSGGVIPISSGGTGNSKGYIRTGQKANTSVGDKATCEGFLTTASGLCSHAEGYNTTASGTYSHAEGNGSTASEGFSHAEGRNTTASGEKSHAEGSSSTASGEASHAECNGSTASGDYSHAEGGSTEASGTYSHAEGGSTKAQKDCSHAEGKSTTASGEKSHAEGRSSTASGEASHAEGSGSTAQGDYSHAEGYNTKALQSYSHAEGGSTIASGYNSHAEGYSTKAIGNYSHATGYETIANYYQMVVGCYNVEKGSTSSYTADNGYFIVGSGTSYSAKANCFRATESNTYGKTYNTSGADYAEMFEWLDENQLNEDRAGKFVTLDGDKIRLANEKDTYILGVVSGNASVIGDSYADQWAYMYEQDVFGRPVYETVTIPEQKNQNGDLIVEKHTETRLKVSSKYDGEKKYIPRNERPEWAAIGLLGKLVCLDDGTAKVNDYVKPNENAVATVSETQTKYRVMRRIDGSHIQIMIL